MGLGREGRAFLLQRRRWDEHPEPDSPWAAFTVSSGALFGAYVSYRASLYTGGIGRRLNTHPSGVNFEDSSHTAADAQPNAAASQPSSSQTADIELIYGAACSSGIDRIF